MNKLFMAVLVVISMLITLPAYARMSINPYWSIEVDTQNNNCNILTNFNAGQHMVIIADGDGVHILIQDQAFSNFVGVHSGVYNQTYSLNGSDNAIRILLRCAVERGYHN